MLSMANGYEQRMRYPWRGLELALKHVEWVQVAWAGVERYSDAFVRSMVGALTLLE